MPELCRAAFEAPACMQCAFSEAPHAITSEDARRSIRLAALINLRPRHMHQSNAPATTDEQIVNETVFGECNHRHWSSFVDQYERRLLVCSQCGGEFDYGDENAPKQTSQSDFLLAAVRKYAREPVLADLTIRQVEAAGWKSMVTESQGIYSCLFERGALKFQSGKCASRAQAVCEDAARLGASGKFGARS